MKITVARDVLLKPLQLLTNIIEKRKTLPILSNILFKFEHDSLFLVATDLEVELQIKLDHPHESNGLVPFTVSGRKLLDIFRAFAEDAIIQLTVQDDGRLLVQANRSRFHLLTLPAEDFPFIEEELCELEVVLPQAALKQIIEKTQFAIAHEDVRYYLNGLFFEFADEQLTTVATDGHRMAFCQYSSPTLSASNELKRYILPRKGVGELYKLLDDGEEGILLKFSKNHMIATSKNYQIISKLVDGKFPDYRKILPVKGDKSFSVERDVLKQLLTRVAILSNQQYHGVYLQLRDNCLRVLTHNPQHEEAQDEIAIDYSFGDLELGCNVNYLVETLANIDTKQVTVYLQDPDSSIQLEPRVKQDKTQLSCIYIVMPMRL